MIARGMGEVERWGGRWRGSGEEGGRWMGSGEEGEGGGWEVEIRGSGWVGSGEEGEWVDGENGEGVDKEKRGGWGTGGWRDGRRMGKGGRRWLEEGEGKDSKEVDRTSGTGEGSEEDRVRVRG